MEEKALPRGWAETTLAELLLNPKSSIVDGPFGSNLKASEYQERGVPILRIQNIKRYNFIPKNLRYILPSKADELARHSYNPGDIIITKLGDPLGESCILPDTTTAGVIVADLVRLRLDNEYTDKKWLCYAINADAIANQLKIATKGTTRPRVNLTHIRELKTTVPPLNEQRRIVAKIEELFSELDKGIESLKTAREQLRVYRQAVLKDAVEGKLTAQWREENQDKLETTEQLLTRIQRERAAHYELQLEEWEVSARKKAKPKKPPHISGLTKEEQNQLPVLPNGWLWIRYGDMCSVVRNGISQKPEGNDGEKIFRISAVRPMEFVIEDVRYIDNNDGRYNEFFLRTGDLIFTRYNGSRAYVGACAEYKSDGTHLFPDKLIQTRIAISSVITGYLEKAINCGESRKFIEGLIRTTAGQSGVSGSDIKAMPVPICSKIEQAIINDRVNEALSCTAKMVEEIEISLQKSKALRQSILKKASSGKLVAQDPSDEPASVLLERIKAEKAVLAAPKNRAKAKRKALA